MLAHLVSQDSGGAVSLLGRRSHRARLVFFWQTIAMCNVIYCPARPLVLFPIGWACAMRLSFGSGARKHRELSVVCAPLPRRVWPLPCAHKAGKFGCWSRRRAALRQRHTRTQLTSPRACENLARLAGLAGIGAQISFRLCFAKSILRQRERASERNSARELPANFLDFILVDIKRKQTRCKSSQTTKFVCLAVASSPPQFV